MCNIFPAEPELEKFITSWKRTGGWTSVSVFFFFSPCSLQQTEAAYMNSSSWFHVSCLPAGLITNTLTLARFAFSALFVFIGSEAFALLVTIVTNTMVQNNLLLMFYGWFFDRKNVKTLICCAQNLRNRTISVFYLSVCHRRAHLKECFETLKRNVPNVDEKKTSNLSVLRSALRYIQVGQRWDWACVLYNKAFMCIWLNIIMTRSVFYFRTIMGC